MKPINFEKYNCLRYMTEIMQALNIQLLGEFFHGISMYDKVS
jgi:hypothetical protein